jgi:hypothetical protein
MKIQKFNEDAKSSKVNADLLAKKLSDKFFSEAEGFDRIFADYDDDENMYSYYICFDEVYDTTIEQLEKFNKHMGYSGWSLFSAIFTYDRDPKIYDTFRLNDEVINGILNEFDVEEKSKKFNL